jgi:hypothetical protein
MLSALTAASALAAAVIPAAGPAGASGITLHSSTKITVVKGVQRWAVSWTNADGYQHGYVMSVDLSQPRLHIRPALGKGLVNDRETTSSMASRTSAIGGINGDLFNWYTYLPRGGVGFGAGIYKTPRRNRPSQFYITRDGKAGIGALTFAGSVTQVSSTGKLGASHVLTAINNLYAADHGQLSMITPSMTGQSLDRCAAVTGPLSKGVLTVKHVYSRLANFDRLAKGTRMLASCGTTGQWLLEHAPLGQHLRIAQSLVTSTGERVQSFISGERTLRMNGTAYRDRTAFHTNGINPETAVCVSKDRLHVLLIAIDGWIGRFGGGNGLTLGELGQLVAALHCYSATVLDGGGSTTMVEKRSGTMHIVNQMPQYYGQRPIPNGLFVYKS